MRKYEKLFQIGETAYLLGISRKTILDYEAAGLITSTVIDEGSGYRYFDAETIAKLQVILNLRQADMPIKQIGNYLRGKLSVEEQIADFKQQIRHIEDAIDLLTMRNIKIGSISSVREISLPAQYCICKEFIASDVSAAINAISDTYYSCLSRKLRLEKKADHFCEFPKDILSDDLYDVDDISMRVCIAIEETAPPSDAVFFPSVKAVSVSYCGGYADGLKAYEDLREYIMNNSLTPAGYPREFYLEGSFDDTSLNNIVCVAVPVKDLSKASIETE